MEKMIQIPEWQFKHIENALRLTKRINKCRCEETAFDREVIKAYTFATEALAKAEQSDSKLDLCSVSNSEASVCSEYSHDKQRNFTDATYCCYCGENLRQTDC